MLLCHVGALSQAVRVREGLQDTAVLGRLNDRTSIKMKHGPHSICVMATCEEGKLFFSGKVECGTGCMLRGRESY